MKNISLALFTFLTLNTFGQRTFEKEGVRIETRLEKVTQQEARDFGYEYEVMTITNTNPIVKTVIFHHDTYYGTDYCWTCDNEEYTFTFKLKPNETIIGSLTDRSKGLTVFVKDHTGKIKEVLSDFKLSNFQVK